MTTIGRSIVDLSQRYSSKDVEITNTEVVYQGFFRMEKLHLRHKTFAGEWTPVFTREMFERGEAVCVLLFDPHADTVVLTEQFRPGALADEHSPWLLELVAGMVEEGESYEDVARRESIEEANCEINELIPICRYWVSPGGTSERVQLYCALTDSSKLGGIYGLPEEHEDIRVHVMPSSEAFSLMQDGIINNAAIIIALQWLQLNKERLTALNP